MDYIDELMIDRVFLDLKIHLAEFLNEAYFDLQHILPNNFLIFIVYFIALRWLKLMLFPLTKASPSFYMLVLCIK